MMSKLCLGVWLALPLAALADDSSDRFIRMRQGMEMQRQQQEAAEVSDDAVYQTAAPQGEQALMLALLQAVNAQNAEQTARLLALYRAEPDHDPDMVLFAEANQAVMADDLDTALSRYRTLAAHNPEFLRGKLDLARLLFVDKQNRESAALFAQIHTGRTEIDGKIQNFRDALQKREAWSGNFSLGAVYDSNINQSSEQTVIHKNTVCGFDSDGLPIVDDSGALGCRDEDVPASAPAAESGHAWAYEAALNKRISLSGNHGIQFNAYAYGRLYPQRSAYSEHNTSLSAAYSFQNRQNSFSIGPIIQHRWEAGRLNHSSAGVSANYSRELSDRASLGLIVEHKYDRYRAEEFSHFNGPQTFVFSHAAYAPAAGWTLFGGYDYLRKNSREAVDSYRRHGLRFGVDKRFADGFNATAQIIWRRSTYQDYHAWLETRRRDRETTFQLDLRHQLASWKGLTPVLSLKHTANRSSAWVNRYRRNEILLKAEYAF